MQFQLQSTFQPTGDQPQAIEKLTQGIRQGLKAQTLLGVTGSGKTFTIAKVIEATQKPTLIISPNKTLAAQLYKEFKAFFLIMLSTILFHIMTITSPKPIYHPLIPILKKRPPLMKTLTVYDTLLPRLC